MITDLHFGTCGMIDRERVIQHWIKSLPAWQNPIDWEAHARVVLAPYPLWTLTDVPMRIILNQSESPLENDGLFLCRVEKYLQMDVQSMPPIILVPIDRNDRRAWMEHKYDDPHLVWQPVDGWHRLHIYLKLNLQKIPAYTPEVKNYADN